MNSNFKKALRDLIGDQISEESAYCSNCDKKTTFKINFKAEKVTCKSCNLEASIPDSVYKEYEKQFKDNGITLN